MRTGVWRRRQPLVKQALGKFKAPRLQGAADRGGARRRGVERRIPGRALDDAHGSVGRDAAPARGCEGTLTACDRSASSAVRSIRSTTATCARRSSSKRRSSSRVVHFVPCANPPHRAAPMTDGALRLKMVRRRDSRASRGFVADDRELEREGPSYTIDTLASFRAEFPAQPLCLLVGMDAFLGLPQWHRWRELLDARAHRRRASARLAARRRAARSGELLRERRTAIRCGACSAARGPRPRAARDAARDLVDRPARFAARGPRPQVPDAR